jgi:hypothetical protein
MHHRENGNLTPQEQEQEQEQDQPAPASTSAASPRPRLDPARGDGVTGRQTVCFEPRSQRLKPALCAGHPVLKLEIGRLLHSQPGVMGCVIDVEGWS